MNVRRYHGSRKTLSGTSEYYLFRRFGALLLALILSAAVLAGCAAAPDPFVVSSGTPEAPTADYGDETSGSAPTAVSNVPESTSKEPTPPSTPSGISPSETERTSASVPPSETADVTPSETLPSESPTTPVPSVTADPTTVSATSASSETPSSLKRVSFLAAGDNIIHEAVFTDAAALASAQAATDGYEEKYYFDPMYENVGSLIGKADLSFVNMECPIAGEEYGISGYPRFNAPLEAAETLVRLGFDIVNVANNHMLDMDDRAAGYRNTVNTLKKLPLTVVGGYTKNDYDDLRIIEKNGVKIAFLSYTTSLNCEQINPASPEMIVPYPAESDIRRQTKKARENADFVVVSMHWGIENETELSGTQTSLARLLCECGVDVILGHHSHTVQKAQWITSGDNRTLCYYSLGNFISTQHPIKNLVGIFASFDFVIGENGERTVENAKAIPHMTWYSTARDGVKIYLLNEVTPELIASHGSQLRVEENKGVFTLADVKAICEAQFPKEEITV
ncbi:MAG: CapA family protein [Clostridia bacterium]|nr:CapA family protein [Clostridia bacterium]